MGGVQGFHFEAKMDACAHFFSLPPWPYLGSYIMLVNTGRPMLGYQCRLYAALCGEVRHLYRTAVVECQLFVWLHDLL